MTARIRDCDPERDRHSIRRMVVLLQDFERELEPTLPPGEAMVDSYLSFLFERGARFAGRMLIAEKDGEVAGFLSVLTRALPEEPDDPPEEYAYISDLIVVPEHRGRGLGRELLARAEALAREAGVGSLHIGVLSKNRVAHELYRDMGFDDFQVHLIKRL